MLTKFVYLSLACFALPMITGDGVKINSGQMDLQIQFDSAIDGGAAKLTFYNGILRLSEIEIAGEIANGEEVTYELAQPTTIDLTTGLASPALKPITIPAGKYSALALEVKGAQKGSLMTLEGYFTDRNQNIVPLQLDIKESLSLALDYENYTVDNALGFSASFLVNPSPWFANISQEELEGADRDSNGLVHIDPFRNAKLYQKLIKELSKSIAWQSAN